MKSKNNLRLFILPGLFLGALIVVLTGSAFARPGASERGARQENRTNQVLQNLKLQFVRDVPLPGGTSRFDYQTIDQSRRKLFISHMGANLMLVYDLDSNKVVGTVRNIPGPTGILAVPELNRVYVSASAANTVYVIDETSLRIIATVPTGSFPDGIAYDPLVNRIFVSCEFGSVVTVFDAQDNKVITNIPTGGHVGNTHYDSVSGMIFSTVQTLGELVEINPKSLRVVTRYRLKGCEGPHGFYIINNPHYAFITGEDNATYSVFDMSSKRIIAHGKVGDGPDVLAYDRGLHRLYVGSESGVVSVFKIRAGNVEEIGSGFLASHAHSVSVDEKTHLVYFPLQDIGGKAVLRILEPH